MSKSKKPQHLHRYKKVNLSRTKDKEYLVYRCTKPTCNHYVPIELSEGKLCECNRCGEPMLITRRILTYLSGAKPMALPHCVNCTKSRKQDDVTAISQFLSGNKV